MFYKKITNLFSMEIYLVQMIIQVDFMIHNMDK